MITLFRTGVCALLALIPAVAIAGAYPVSVAPARKAGWQSTVSVLGEARSRAWLTLRAPVGGTLQGPFTAQGARVGAGHVIARINPPGFTARLTEAHRHILLDREQLDQTRSLYRKRLATLAQLQQAEANLAIDTARLAALHQIRSQQQLTAPAAGTIRYLLPPGALVIKGAAVAHLSGAAGTWVRCFVTPRQAIRLRVGDRVELSGGGQQGHGSIAAIGASARRDGMVEVFIQPHRNRWLPGQWLRLKLPGARGKAWRLPTRALVMRGAQAMVYIVKQGQARAVNVRLAYQDKQHVWVVGPLKPGEPVIVRGAGTVDNGAEVSVVHAAAPVR